MVWQLTEDHEQISCGDHSGVRFKEVPIYGKSQWSEQRCAIHIHIEPSYLDHLHPSRPLAAQCLSPIGLRKPRSPEQQMITKGLVT